MYYSYIINYLWKQNLLMHHLFLIILQNLDISIFYGNIRIICFYKDIAKKK